MSILEPQDSALALSPLISVLQAHLWGSAFCRTGSTFSPFLILNTGSAAPDHSLTRSCPVPLIPLPLTFSPWGMEQPPKSQIGVIFPLYSDCPPQNSLTLSWCCPNQYFPIWPTHPRAVYITIPTGHFDSYVLSPRSPQTQHLQKSKVSFHSPVRQQSILYHPCLANATTIPCSLSHMVTWLGDLT